MHLPSRIPSRVPPIGPGIRWLVAALLVSLAGCQVPEMPDSREGTAAELGSPPTAAPAGVVPTDVVSGRDVAAGSVSRVAGSTVATDPLEEANLAQSPAYRAQ